MIEKIIDEIEPDIFIIYGNKPSSHSYLIKGLYKNVLIDTGTEDNITTLKKAFDLVNMKLEDIHLVICTHEHYDHIGGIKFFYKTAFLGANRFAATKIDLDDEIAIHAAKHHQNPISVKINIWFETRNLIDLGNYKLKTLHMPGHTSGSMCIYEPFKRFLFSGDTVYDKGIVTKISDSGSLGDYINSLERLDNYKIKRIFPGHGKICETPQESITLTIKNAKKMLKEMVDKIRQENLGKENPKEDNKD